MGATGQLEIRTPEQAELLRAKVVELAIARRPVHLIASELEVSWEWTRKIIHEELRAARDRRVTQQDLLLEVELQAVETSLRHLEGMIAAHPWKTKAHVTWLRVQERFLLLQGIRLTLPSSPAVQVNVNNGPRFDYTGASDEELAEMAALEVELVREGTAAPPMLPEGLGEG